MVIFDNVFKSKTEQEREERRKRHQNERKVEQDIENFTEAIAKLTEERTIIWNQARELLKSGRRAEAQRTLLFYKKFDIVINKLEKQKFFLKCQALQVSTTGNVNKTLYDIMTMAADHDIDPNKLAEGLNDVQMIVEEILDSDKVMNKAFDKDLDHMAQEVAAGDISYKDDELMAALENECAAEVLGPKVADTSLSDKPVSHEDISAGAERLKKILSMK